MRRLAMVVACFFPLLLAGCGKTATKAVDAPRGQIVNVDMRSSHYQPDSVTVERGRKVTFRFTNRDQIAHDAFVGDEDAQKEHEKEMREARTDKHMGHSMAEEGAVTVPPGKTKVLAYTFDAVGETLIGCHEPGHYGAGMVMKVMVRER